MAKKIKPKKIEDQDTTDIYINYIRDKRMTQTKGYETAGEIASWAGIGTVLVMLDWSGFMLATWLLFGDEIGDASKKTVRGIDAARLKRIGKKQIALNNFAGQEIKGSIRDVFALMALQEELIAQFREKEKNPSMHDAFNKEDRIGKIIKRMQDEAQKVEVEFGSEYKIIKSSAEIKKFDLREQILKSSTPNKKLLKTLRKRKK